MEPTPNSRAVSASLPDSDAPSTSGDTSDSGAASRPNLYPSLSGASMGLYPSLAGAASVAPDGRVPAAEARVPAEARPMEDIEVAGPESTSGSEGDDDDDVASVSEVDVGFIPHAHCPEWPHLIEVHAELLSVAYEEGGRRTNWRIPEYVRLIVQSIQGGISSWQTACQLPIIPYLRAELIEPRVLARIQAVVDHHPTMANWGLLQRRVWEQLTHMLAREVSEDRLMAPPGSDPSRPREQ